MIMNFNTSPIAAEIKAILNSGGKLVHGYYYAVLYVNGKEISPKKLTNIDIYRDYLKNYTDEILVELVLSAGEFENDIIPYKDNIEIKIFNRPYAEGETLEDVNQPVNIIHGRAILTDTKNHFFSNPTSAHQKESRDILAVQKVEFQILNPIMELFRMQSVGGIFNNVIGADLIKSLYMYYSTSNDVEDAYKVKGVDVAPNYNTKVRETISIPMGTKAPEIADYINKNIEGIYSTGMGIYLQNDMWYLYPTYDVERFTNAPKTLTIVRVPSDVLPQADRTYSNKNGNVTIIANKNTELVDHSELAQLNEGNGLRFADAASMMEDFVKIDGNKATASRGKNVNEFVGEHRATKLNNVSSTHNKISSNMYYEMSKLAKRSGSIMNVDWEHSDASILFPGMPVRFIAHQGNSLTTVYGVLLCSHEMIVLEGKGPAARKHKRQTSLSIFIKRKTDWNPEVTSEDSV